MSLIPTTVLTLIYSVLVTLIYGVFQSPVYAESELSATWAFHHGKDQYKITWSDPNHLRISRASDDWVLAECLKIQLVIDENQIQPTIDLECQSTVIPAFKTLATYSPATVINPNPEIRFGNWMGGYHGFGLVQVNVRTASR